MLSRLADFAGRFFRALSILENVICAAGLFITTFMTFFQVLNRYWLHYQIIWLSDLSLFIFIGFMFLVIPLTTRQDGHTGVDVFVESVFAKRPLGRIAYVAFLKVVSIGTLVVFLIPPWSFALRAAKYPQYATLVRWFNTSWLMEMLFVSIALCLLHLLYGLACDVVKFNEMRNARERG